MHRLASVKVAVSRLAAVGLVAVVALGLSGCGFTGLYGMSLPGGPDLGSHPYRVVVELSDALDLVPAAAVRVNDVPVGKVDKIDLEGWHARVTLLVNGEVDLPANARAELRQTSLLGEKFVSLAPPVGEPAAPGRLADGAVIPLARTGRSPEVEEVLSALSLLLNGGGVEQLQTITRELNKALSGREEQVRALLAHLNTFVGGLDGQRAQLTRALTSVDRLSATLARQKDLIGRTLDRLPGALSVLVDQRRQLTTMLTSLSRLGVTATRVINASGADLLANLNRLRPALQGLVRAGSSLPRSLDLLLSYPFPQQALAGIRGDYVNAYATLDLDLTDLFNNLVTSRYGPGATAPAGRPGTATPPALPGLAGPGAPGLSGLPGLAGSGGPGGGAGTSGIPDLLGILLGGG
jgi:phospholipid/cholesterol/gamma-HCH transport system substrate-binding protein